MGPDTGRDWLLEHINGLPWRESCCPWQTEQNVVVFSFSFFQNKKKWIFSDLRGLKKLFFLLHVYDQRCTPQLCGWLDRTSNWICFMEVFFPFFLFFPKAWLEKNFFRWRVLTRPHCFVYHAKREKGRSCFMRVNGANYNC